MIGIIGDSGLYKIDEPDQKTAPFESKTREFIVATI